MSFCPSDSLHTAPVSFHGTEMPPRGGAELGVSGGGSWKHQAEVPGMASHILFQRPWCQS